MKDLNRRCAEVEGWTFWDEPKVFTNPPRILVAYRAGGSRVLDHDDVIDYNKDMNAAQRIVDLAVEKDWQMYRRTLHPHWAGETLVSLHSKHIEARLEAALEVLE